MRMKPAHQLIVLAIVLLAVSRDTLCGKHKKTKKSVHVHTMESGQSVRHPCAGVFTSLDFKLLREVYCMSMKRHRVRHATRSWISVCHRRLHQQYKRRCARCTTRKSCRNFRFKLTHAAGKNIQMRSGVKSNRYFQVCSVEMPMVYDPLISVCCGGHVYRRNASSGCCGGQLMDVKTHSCCGGSTVNKDAVCVTSTLYADTTTGETNTTKAVFEVTTTPNPVNRNVVSNVQYQSIDSYITVLALTVTLLVLILSVTICLVIKKKRRHADDDVRCCETDFTTSTASTQHKHRQLTQQDNVIQNKIIPSTDTEIGRMRKEVNVNCNHNVCIISTVNIRSFSSTSVQTGEIKTSNITNAMGLPYSYVHVFNKNNKTLQLDESSVKLTLSENDVEDRDLECHATTFRNAHQVHTFLQDLSPNVGCLVSPMVEYFSPSVKRLRDFACVDLENNGMGRHLHVWKIEKNINTSDTPCLVEVPRLDSVNTEDEKLDAYYETVRPGTVRVFVRTFSCLVCTACVNEEGYTRHNHVQIDANVYVTEENNHLRLTLYLADPIFHLADYRYMMKERHSTNAKLERQYLRLPTYVDLQKDGVSVTLHGFSETDDDCGWSSANGAPTDKKFQFCEIVNSHEQNEDGLPFTQEWLLNVEPRSGLGVKSYLKFLIESRCSFVNKEEEHFICEPTRLVVLHELRNSNLLRQAYSVLGEVRNQLMSDEDHSA